MKPTLRATWKTRGRGAGVRGPGVRGLGVWKTRGLVENAGYEFIFTETWIFLTKMRRQNFVSLYCDEYQFSTSASNALLDQKSKLNISWERKPFKRQRVVHRKWASLCYVTHFGTSIYDLKNFVCVLLTCCEKCTDLFCLKWLHVPQNLCSFFYYRVDV